MPRHSYTLENRTSDLLRQDPRLWGDTSTRGRLVAVAGHLRQMHNSKGGRGEITLQKFGSGAETALTFGLINGILLTVIADTTDRTMVLLQATRYGEYFKIESPIEERSESLDILRPCLTPHILRMSLGSPGYWVTLSRLILQESPLLAHPQLP